MTDIDISETVYLYRLDATQPADIRESKVRGRMVEQNHTRYEFTDRHYLEFATRAGLKYLACVFDGLDFSREYRLDQFSEKNHFAHIAFREMADGETI